MESAGIPSALLNVADEYRDNLDISVIFEQYFACTDISREI